jgi:protein ImuA
VNMMTDSPAPLARLKCRIDALARPVATKGDGLFTLGEEASDARLGGGLARGGLHEVLAGDGASAQGFALMLALRCYDAASGKPICWVRTDQGVRDTGGVYAPGLVELGLDPDAIVMVQAPDALSALRVAADIIGCMGVGAMILELGDARRLDLTASRRLSLAAQKSGVTSLLIRPPASSFASAAATRWQVSAAPSRALPGDAPGHPLLRIELLRHRGGVAPFETLLEWDRDQRIFSAPSLPRPVFALPARRTVEDGERAAA